MCYPPTPQPLNLPKSFHVMLILVLTIYSGVQIGRERLPRKNGYLETNLWSRFFPSLSLLKYVSLGQKS